MSMSKTKYKLNILQLVHSYLTVFCHKIIYSWFIRTNILYSQVQNKRGRTFIFS